MDKWHRRFRSGSIDERAHVGCCLSIGNNCDRAAFVGPENPRAGGLQRGKRCGRGVSEEVVPAHRDDRVARVDGGDERWRRRVGRPVVANLQHRATQVDAFVEESRFGGGAGVAGEEHAERAITQYERNRVFVDVVA